MRIDSVNRVGALGSVGRATGPAAPGTAATRIEDERPSSSGADFQSALTSALKNLNSLEVTADRLAGDLAAGRTDDIVGVTLAAEKASLGFELAVRLRNDVLEAYREIMRMPV